MNHRLSFFERYFKIMIQVSTAGEPIWMHNNLVRLSHNKEKKNK